MNDPEVSPESTTATEESRIQYMSRGGTIKVIQVEDEPSKFPIRAAGICLAISSTVIMLLVIMFIIWGETGNGILKDISSWDKSNPGIGVLFCFLIMCSVQPIFTGTTGLILLMSYFYGWAAFPMVYVSSILGGGVTLLLSRAMHKRGYLSIEHLIAYFPSHKKYIMAANHMVAQDEHSMYVVSLLQLSFLPYGLLNLVLGVVDVSNLDFTVAVAVSRVKYIGYVALGVSITEVSKLVDAASFLNMNPYSLIVGLVTFVFTMIAAVIVTIILKRYVFHCNAYR